MGHEIKEVKAMKLGWSLDHGMVGFGHETLLFEGITYMLH